MYGSWLTKPISVRCAQSLRQQVLDARRWVRAELKYMGTAAEARADVSRHFRQLCVICLLMGTASISAHPPFIIAVLESPNHYLSASRGHSARMHWLA